MAGRNLGPEVKVREFVLVPSYKLKALEEAGAESVNERKHHDKADAEQGTTKENKTSSNIAESPFEEDSSDKDTKRPTESEERQTSGIRKRRGGGASLDERRKRLRKLWLDL